ncbi:MAG TPA: PIN domain-containing protein [Chloroflexota bacterium]
MILLDTSGLLAAIDFNQPRHLETRAALHMAAQPRILSPFVLAELDYLLATRVGQDAELALLDEVARGAYYLDSFEGDDIRKSTLVTSRYVDLRLGLADASIVVLADRYGCNDILTLDERHFRTVLGPNRTPFRLLPADAD